jgi:hypothetical protein
MRGKLPTGALAPATGGAAVRVDWLGSGQRPPPVAVHRQQTENQKGEFKERRAELFRIPKYFWRNKEAHQ